MERHTVGRRRREDRKKNSRFSMKEVKKTIRIPTPLFFFLFFVQLLLSSFLCCTILSSSTTLLVSGLSLSTPPPQNIPKSQQKFKKEDDPNRRKSPALWRDDLFEGDDEDEESAGPKQQRSQLLSSPPEVMSPVGGWEQLQAAIANGADSIYLGLSAFSARARASNFDPIEELPDAVKLAHRHSVRVYVALNTLVFDNELHEVEELIENCIRAKVDALIIQDIGIAKLANRIIMANGGPDQNHQLEIHASTQQTITSADGAAFCYELMETPRVVLGRELSVSEIQKVSQNLPAPPTPLPTALNGENLELEVFVHGALCVSYSGQCFSSEAWGGRSANRGQCAQACRLPYGLIDNGELRELQDFAYLLSPQDLCGLDQVPELLAARVSCLKIEGRLKDAAYVAATTRAYRTAVDQAWDDYCKNHDIPNTHNRIISDPETIITRDELAQVFSRGQDEANNGLTPGFLEGSQHQRLVRGRSPRHRGVHVGRVLEGSNSKRGLVIVTDDIETELELLKPGDGIVVDRGLAQEEELGGSIYEIDHQYQNNKKGQRRRLTTIQFSRNTHNKWKKYDDSVAQSNQGREGGEFLAPAGAHVWKTSDAVVDKKLKRLSEAPPPKTVASISVSGQIGAPLRVTIFDATTGQVGTGQTTGELEAADGAGLSPKSVRKAIGKLGNTQWTIEDQDLEAAIDVTPLEERVWCPMSWIKEARRLAVEDLQSKVTSCDADGDKSEKDGSFFDESAPHVSLNVVSDMLEEAYDDDDALEENLARLSVLARDFEQVDRLCQMVERSDDGEMDMVDEIVVDFLEVDGMREAVERIRKVDRDSLRVVVASPRIIKPGESGIWRTLLQLEPDALLVRSTGLLYRMMKLGGPGTQIEVKSNGKEQKVKVPELIGDFSLNVANALTAWELIKYGCSRVTASFDLSANAITELLETLGSTNAGNVEVIAHTHLPIFHTEHCVFARFLTNGNSYVDCGHACTRHNVHLRDQTGADNLVLADMGCRNTVFSATAQSAVHSLKEWMSVGLRRLRIELVDESPDDVELIVNGYMDVLNGDAKPKEVWEALDEVRDSNGRRGGVSHGSLRNQVERRAGEIA